MFKSHAVVQSLCPTIDRLIRVKMQVEFPKKFVQWPLIFWAPVIAYYMIFFVGLVHAPFYEASLELANA